ncbi:cytochrome c oxidase assembly protein [Nonomuraea indica]|uniref:cytochrome c oxidase assembly protein n=1 Tax=Nonomuraea indica TaxID=1581193 RepID=UPI001C5D166F|nr:cytochrome c oxidase assembly protein [Nonomuraea indica]
MTPGHAHQAGPEAAQLPALCLVVLAAAVYLMAAHRLRRRGSAWSWTWQASFITGAVLLAVALTLPVPAGPFTSHMSRHLLAGMVAPVLLVLGRPLRLALRVLRPSRVRRAVLAVVHSRPAGWMVSPAVAVVLDMGGLWLLYRTPLLAASGHHGWLHAVVHMHVVVAGTLFAFAVCQVEPVRRRWSLPWRAGALLVGGAAHAVLAKTLYATPPPGTAFAAPDLRAGAQLMYYGGDAVELALAAVVAAQWYAVTGRAHRRAFRRARRRTTAAPGPAPVT